MTIYMNQPVSVRKLERRRTSFDNRRSFCAREQFAYGMNISKGYEGGEVWGE